MPVPHIMTDFLISNHVKRKKRKSKSCLYRKNDTQGRRRKKISLVVYQNKFSLYDNLVGVH
jgi:hypothetical protein